MKVVDYSSPEIPDHFYFRFVINTTSTDIDYYNTTSKPTLAKSRAKPCFHIYFFRFLHPLCNKILRTYKKGSLCTVRTETFNIHAVTALSRCRSTAPRRLEATEIRGANIVKMPKYKIRRVINGCLMVAVFFSLASLQKL